jgi:preprotein translocase subunit SecA
MKSGKKVLVLDESGFAKDMARIFAIQMKGPEEDNKPLVLNPEFKKKIYGFIDEILNNMPQQFYGEKIRIASAKIESEHHKALEDLERGYGRTISAGSGSMNEEEKIYRRAAIEGIYLKIKEEFEDIPKEGEEFNKEAIKDARTMYRGFALGSLDKKWRDNLQELESLRQGIGLRAYGQKDPLVEYKIEAGKQFEQMIEESEEAALENIFRAPKIRAWLSGISEIAPTMPVATQGK